MRFSCCALGTKTNTARDRTDGDYQLGHFLVGAVIYGRSERKHGRDEKVLGWDREVWERERKTKRCQLKDACSPELSMLVWLYLHCKLVYFPHAVLLHDRFHEVIAGWGHFSLALSFSHTQAYSMSIVYTARPCVYPRAYIPSSQWCVRCACV